MTNIVEKFEAHWRSQQDIAPSTLLGIRYNSIVETLLFIENDIRAIKLKTEINNIFKISNWLLDTAKIQSFIQVIGEAQFWKMAEDKGVNLERIPEQGKYQKKTPDFRLAHAVKNMVCFEVKTLSVVSPETNLKDMNETSFKSQLSLAEQIAEKKLIATSTIEISPHGTKSNKKLITNLIENIHSKTENNLKAGQYTDEKTILVLNLIIIDGYYNGNSSLRPVVAGYPEKWNIMSGVYWSVAFGNMGHIVFGISEFEGKPSIEGELGRVGVLLENPNIAALLLLVQSLEKPPTIYGLKRQTDNEVWESEYEELSDVFFKIVENNWNDELDSNGWRLNEI